ncbi:hypothetical protein QOZ80_4BG0357550 [Eleusine coracana subsp. coracana]|nr:hypothetical protein QOZ80_4BG0357550 [Eleusine coracana subsp. coracana]
MKGVRLPPGPARLPILGNLHQLGTLPHRSLRELARQHGPVMLLQLGMVPAVVVSSAEAAREVMKVHDADCCSRPASPGPRLLSYDLKDVAFAPYDEYWREMRKLFIVELLSMRRVKAAWYAREQQVDKLLEDLRCMGSKPVTLNDHIFALVDGIVGTVAFGNIYGTEQFAQKKRFQQVLNEAMGVLGSFSTEDFFPNVAGRFINRFKGLVSRRERIFMELDTFYEMVIDQHMDPTRPKPENGGDLVDVLINLWKEKESMFRFTRDHVKAMIMDTFVGGIGPRRRRWRRAAAGKPASGGRCRRGSCSGRESQVVLRRVGGRRRRRPRQRLRVLLPPLLNKFNTMPARKAYLIVFGGGLFPCKEAVTIRMHNPSVIIAIDAKVRTRYAWLPVGLQELKDESTRKDVKLRDAKVCP